MFSPVRRRGFNSFDYLRRDSLLSTCQHGQVRRTSDSSLVGLQEKLTSRSLPLAYDYLSPQPSHLLNLTLADFLPGVAPASSSNDSVATELPSIYRPPRMPVGYHLIYFPPQVRESQLLSDGTDVLHTPGHPFDCRMWAGGWVRFPQEGGPLLNGSRAVCLEGIRDVTIKGREGEEKLFVGIERRVGQVSEQESEESIRGRLWTKNEHEDGDAVVVERRNLVFMRPKPPKQENLGDEKAVKDGRIVRAPSDPEYSHVILPSKSLLFRFSALTFNAHSIHLDQHYAQNIEGYRNLLVHGPLSLTIMLTVLRCHFHKYRQAIRNIEYRNLAPLYVEEEMKVCTKRKQNGRPGAWDVWIEGSDGGLRVRGTVHTEEIEEDPEDRLAEGLPPGATQI
ncbi:hypothetical protein FQN54_007427 [Arachnomyces sp. PD_36]|nr:hypothetical protein FQN54_007427 [Arachnomyces sp. PD_36]